MAPTPRLPDYLVDRLDATATVDWPFLTVVGDDAAADMPGPIRALLTVRTWHDAAVLAAAASTGASAATDNQGFRFRTDGQVVVFDPLDDSVIVSRPAFTGLLLRLLHVLVEAATTSADPVVGSADWLAILAARDRLREQAG